MSRVPVLKYAPVAAEGRPVFLAALALALLVVGVWGFGMLWCVLPAVVAVGWYFRDPHREAPAQPLAIVAPASGVVTRAGQAFDPWLGREAERVTVRSGLLDVHTLFSPIEGKIVEQWSNPRHGSGVGIGYLIRTDEGDDVVLAIERINPRGPLRFDYQPGERVGHGRRIGFASLGCRVSVYCSPGSRPVAALDTGVTGAQTVLMTLVHESPVSAIAHEEDAD